MPFLRPRTHPRRGPRSTVMERDTAPVPLIQSAPHTPSPQEYKAFKKRYSPTPRPSRISIVMERDTTSRDARSLAVGAYLQACVQVCCGRLAVS